MLTAVTILKRHHLMWGEGDRSFWYELGADYLAKLVRGLERHVPQVTRIVCLTDSPECMAGGVEPIAIHRPQDPTWWNKLQAFMPGTLTGRCLYLDLDNVLAGSIDELLTIRPEPLVMADDEYIVKLPNASTMLFEAEAMAPVWESYLIDPVGIQQRFSTWPHASDQAYLASIYPDVPLFQEHLPPGYVINARHLDSGDAWRSARLVFGHSMVKPHESGHPFFARHWV